jgi:hypothetical protein
MGIADRYGLPVAVEAGNVLDKHGCSVSVWPQSREKSNQGCIDTYTASSAFGGTTVELDGSLDIRSAFDASAFSPLWCSQPKLFEGDGEVVSDRTSPSALAPCAKRLRRATRRRRMMFFMIALTVRLRDGV